MELRLAKKDSPALKSVRNNRLSVIRSKRLRLRQKKPVGGRIIESSHRNCTRTVQGTEIFTVLDCESNNLKNRRKRVCSEFPVFKLKSFFSIVSYRKCT